MLKNYLTLLALATPPIAVVMVSIYYTVFLTHFDGFNIGIYSVADYFDKAIELVWPLFITGPLLWLAGFLFALAPLLPFEPILKLDTPIRREEKKAKGELFGRSIEYTFIVLVVWTLPSTWAPGILAALIGYIVIELFFAWCTATSKTLREGFRYVPYFVVLPIYCGYVVSQAEFDAIRIRDEFSDPNKSETLDVVSAGLIRAQDGKLTLLSSEYGIIAESRLMPVDTSSAACVVFKLICSMNESGGVGESKHSRR